MPSRTSTGCYGKTPSGEQKQKWYLRLKVRYDDFLSGKGIEDGSDGDGDTEDAEATLDKEGTVSLQELIVSNLAQTDALCKLLIKKGLITEAEFVEKLKAERATYQAMFKSVR